jgi:hypothetical protein
VEGLRISTKNLSQDSRSPGQDFNPGFPEYKAGVLTNRFGEFLVRLRDYSPSSLDNIKSKIVKCSDV